MSVKISNKEIYDKLLCVEKKVDGSLSSITYLKYGFWFLFILYGGLLAVFASM